MKITIVGTGYVGLVTGACLAEIGHDVFCLDVDPRKIDILNGGGVPIHEPGLLELIARNRAAGRITFSTDIAASVEHGEVQFIAVGTPPDEDGSADLQYVLEAARSIGASDWTIIMRHILPGTISSVIVYLTMRIGTSIITAASLSFLGLGAQPPTPEWGAMLNEARADMVTAPHIALFPSLAIFLTVLAFNLLGDGLRDALDPKLDRP